MNTWLCVLAFAMAASSAVALYAASPHCMWRALRGWPRLACMAGIVLALLSLTVWIDVLGIAVGLSAMLASWMLALAVQPYLALFIGTPTTDPTSPKPCGSDFSRDALDSFDPQTSRLKPLPQGDRR